MVKYVWLFGPLIVFCLWGYWVIRPVPPPVLGVEGQIDHVYYDRDYFGFTGTFTFGPAGFDLPSDSPTSYKYRCAGLGRSTADDTCRVMITVLRQGKSFALVSSEDRWIRELVVDKFKLVDLETSKIHWNDGRERRAVPFVIAFIIYVLRVRKYFKRKSKNT